MSRKFCSVIWNQDKLINMMMMLLKRTCIHGSQEGKTPCELSPLWVIKIHNFSLISPKDVCTSCLRLGCVTHFKVRSSLYFQCFRFCFVCNLISQKIDIHIGLKCFLKLFVNQFPNVYYMCNIWDISGRSLHLVVDILYITTQFIVGWTFHNRSDISLVWHI